MSSGDLSMKKPRSNLFLSVIALPVLGCAAAAAAQQAEFASAVSSFLALQTPSFVLNAATVTAGLLLTLPFAVSTLPLLRRRQNRAWAIRKS